MSSQATCLSPSHKDRWMHSHSLGHNNSKARKNGTRKPVKKCVTSAPGKRRKTAFHGVWEMDPSWGHTEQIPGKLRWQPGNGAHIWNCKNIRDKQGKGYERHTGNLNTVPTAEIFALVNSSVGLVFASSKNLQQNPCLTQTWITSRYVSYLQPNAVLRSSDSHGSEETGVIWTALKSQALPAVCTEMLNQFGRSGLGSFYRLNCFRGRLN